MEEEKERGKEINVSNTSKGTGSTNWMPKYNHKLFDEEWVESLKSQTMGKRLRIKIIDQGIEKVIQVRECMTINNLKAIIEGVLKEKVEWTSLKMNGKELEGHGKLRDLGIVDGFIMDLSWQSKVEKARGEVSEAKNIKENISGEEQL